MPISSLPSDYGIGCFSKSAYEFVDWLKEAGQTYWQILPLGPTSYGDSPYQSFSTFAGNPYFIDLDTLVEEGVLDKKDCEKVNWGKKPDEVDYEKIYKGRYPLLRKAYENSDISKNPDYQKFVAENSWWLSDYALFMALKSHFNNVSWGEWETDIKFRKPEAMSRYEEQLSDDIGYWKFIQFEFYLQWNALKQYANSNGIEIIGDIPIYMGYDSVDVWANQGEFQLDENLTPIKVAGVPPDAFSDAGQKWGNPLYDYDKMEANGFSWWRKRMAASAKLYDVIRIDHFIGIVKYYTIPADMPDARQGEYRQGPGQKLLDVINESIGDKKIIAEDLGVEVPEVAKILKENGYPGMKVLEFAFDSGEENDYLPHKYTENCVVYTGTHDNDTVMGWLETAKPEDVNYARSYCQMPDDEPFNWGLIRVAYESKADTAIVPMQDILGLGKEARMNIPSTLGGNWVWRLDGAALTDELADKLKTMSEKSGRLED